MSKKITLFGNIDNILYKLIINELNLMINNNDKHSYYIDFSINTIPIINDSEIFDFIKSNNVNTSYISCPVCITDYILNNKVLLPCNHYVCNKCFIELIRNKSYICPLCRKSFKHYILFQI